MKVKLEGSFDAKTIGDALAKLLTDLPYLAEKQQISVTSYTGEDEWDETCGEYGKFISDARVKYDNQFLQQTDFNTINKTLKGTPFEEIVETNFNYCRWRLMKITPDFMYPIHRDGGYVGDDFYKQFRIHYPIWTNPKAYMIFFDEPVTKDSDFRLEPSGEQKTEWVHLEQGKIYEVDTSEFHTVCNFGETNRYHLVGTRVEKDERR